LAGKVKDLLYLPTGPEAYKLYGSAWTGQNSWLKSNPTASKGFCDSISEAVAFIHNPANLAVSAKALSDDTKVDLSIATDVVKNTYGDYSTTLPKDSLMKTFQSYHDYGITKTDMSSNYDTLVQPVS
jgi:ABC-type nitrate/sulfonate/bicarbonate transport system substrate-binding protein